MIRPRPVLAILTALFLTVLLIPAAWAATFRGDQETVVAAGETVEGNLYAGGQTVRIEGTVTGDVIAGGNRVEVASGGVIEGDLIAGGQGIIVRGDVEGDVRAAGYMVQVESGGHVGGELLGAGFSIGVADGATIDQDVIAAGGQGLLDGAVGGDVHFAGGGLDIQGQIAGDVDAEVAPPDEAAPNMFWTSFMQDVPALPRMAPMGLTVGSQARIDGRLSYASPDPSNLPPDIAGRAEFRQQAGGAEAAEAPAVPVAPPSASRRFASWTVDFLKWFLSLAALGLVLAWLAPRLLGTAGLNLTDRALPSAGSGCLTMMLSVAGVIFIFLALIFGATFVSSIQLGHLAWPLFSASMLGFALLTFGVSLLAWIGRVVLGLWIGQWLLVRLAPAQADGPYGRYLAVLLGLFVYALVTSLPWIGDLAGFVGVLFGLGALVLLGWTALSDLRRASPPPTVA